MNEKHSLILAHPKVESQTAEKAFQLLEKKHFEFTRERLFARDREKYELIVSMLSEGLAVRMISRACRVSHNTVENVRRREGRPVAEDRARLLEVVKSASRICAERLEELAPEMGARDAAIAFGILTEKQLLLQGDATQIIVNREEQMSHQDFNALLNSLPRADAKVIEVNAEGAQ
jgi:hypothetical protein